MKILKGIAIVSVFGVVIYKIAYLFGFMVGIVKSLLSYFCYIGVSGPAIADASSWLFFLGVFLFAYFSYSNFFK